MTVHVHKSRANLQIHSRPKTPAYQRQTKKYLPSTFVEVLHFSATQSVEPINWTPRKWKANIKITFLRVIPLRWK